MSRQETHHGGTIPNLLPKNCQEVSKAFQGHKRFLNSHTVYHDCKRPDYYVAFLVGRTGIPTLNLPPVFHQVQQ